MFKGRWLLASLGCLLVIGCCTCVVHAKDEGAVERQEKRAKRVTVFEYPVVRMAKVSDDYAYKQVGDEALNLYVFQPDRKVEGEKRPAIIFFFGGGWKSGSPGQFWKQCEYLAARGMVAITVDYRVKKRHGVAAVECVYDANDAMRWVREHAKMLGIDETRIAAGGGSSGGHLGAATAIFGHWVPNQKIDEVEAASLADLLVLYNPVMATYPVGETAYEFDRDMLLERMGTERLEDLSPFDHVRSGLPATLMMFGKKDVMLLEWAEAYTEKAKGMGNDVTLLTWEGRGHGFFNYQRSAYKMFYETTLAVDAFLVKHGYLKGEADEALLKAMDWRKKKDAQ
ncbi:alpha/beta hydrolase fold domain-containing protein [Planctomycetota bacterium]|nr:alpha/beta hydrolase fold domain-containing protein [Planctomycetota bacterium]